MFRHIFTLSSLDLKKINNLTHLIVIEMKVIFVASSLRLKLLEFTLNTQLKGYQKIKNTQNQRTVKC